jgi:hypothetical protein
VDGSQIVAEVALELHRSDILPNESDGSTFQEADFLLARKFLTLLWQTYQVAADIHLNGYGGYYKSHLFMLQLLSSMALCNNPQNLSGNPCIHHRRNKLQFTV